MEDKLTSQGKDLKESTQRLKASAAENTELNVKYVRHMTP